MFQERLETQEILDEVLERVQEIEKRAEESRKQKQAQANGHRNTYTMRHETDLPPDNYRELSIIPDVREILSEKKPYLRANIVNGKYDSPEHYLDVIVSFDIRYSMKSNGRLTLISPFRFIFVFCVKISLGHYVKESNSIKPELQVEISMYVFTRMFMCWAAD